MYEVYKYQVLLGFQIMAEILQKLMHQICMEEMMKGDSWNELFVKKMKKRSPYLQDAHPVNIRRMHGRYDKGHQIFIMNIG